MRTLFEITEAVQANEKPEYDELFYAVLALERLLYFSGTAIRSLAEAKRKQKRPILTFDPIWQENADFERTKKAMQKSPIQWIGWKNDPANPDYQKFRRATRKLTEKILGKYIEEEQNEPDQN